MGKPTHMILAEAILGPYTGHKSAERIVAYLHEQFPRRNIPQLILNTGYIMMHALLSDIQYDLASELHQLIRESCIRELEVIDVAKYSSGAWGMLPDTTTWFGLYPSSHLEIMAGKVVVLRDGDDPDVIMAEVLVNNLPNRAHSRHPAVAYVRDLFYLERVGNPGNLDVFTCGMLGYNVGGQIRDLSSWEPRVPSDRRVAETVEFGGCRVHRISEDGLTALVRMNDAVINIDPFNNPWP